MLIRVAVGHIGEFMVDDGCSLLFQRMFAPHTAEVLFSKIGDRKVLGSMNDLVFSAKYHIIEHGESSFSISHRLNEMPMSYLGYNNPREALLSLRIEK
jgi:hypothetical protein